MAAEEGANTGICVRCQGGLQWEFSGSGRSERWLGMCVRCGWMRALRVDERHVEENDPLTSFLAPSAQPDAVTPAWIRFCRLSHQRPWRVHWSHAGACTSCTAAVVFETSEGYPSVTCTYRLCINCGDTSAIYVRPLTGRTIGHLSGNEWAPPCPAVVKLRRAVFNPQKWFMVERRVDLE
jgi:hypothetical protein